MDIFWEIHSNLEREGPGDTQTTLGALSMIDDLGKNLKILDLGCGPGKHTIDLAKNLDGQIVAIDIHQPFLDELILNAEKEGLTDKIKAIRVSMAELPFKYSSFDLIWGEGSIYNMGFEKGIKTMNKYLKDNGYLAVSEISWLKDNPPKEVYDFWNDAYSEIKSVDEKLKDIENSSYDIVGHFTLSEDAWWQYYNPIVEKINMLKEKYRNDIEKLLVLDRELVEVELYKKYSEYYGYEFYIMKKKQKF